MAGIVVPGAESRTTSTRAPTLRSGRNVSGTDASSLYRRGSSIITMGTPGTAIDPASIRFSVTIPEKGAVTLVYDSAVLAAFSPALAWTSRASAWARRSRARS